MSKLNFTVILWLFGLSSNFNHQLQFKRLHSFGHPQWLQYSYNGHQEWPRFEWFATLQTSLNRLVSCQNITRQQLKQPTVYVIQQFVHRFQHYTQKIIFNKMPTSVTWQPWVAKRTFATFFIGHLNSLGEQGQVKPILSWYRKW